jgi:TRAP-type mannitol/chloroaromatic compound transport system permease small subunit
VNGNKVLRINNSIFNQSSQLKNKSTYILLGYLLFLFGFTAIVLQLVGVQWVFLSFLERGGRLFSFIVKILMVLAGIVMIVLARTDWERERRDSGEV